MFLKNSAVTGFMIGNFIAIADGSTVTTGTPTCKRLLDGTGAAMANAASYNADALAWEIDLAAADTNGDMVGYSFTLADCLPISFTFRTTLNLVGTAQTGDAYARLGAPAGASVSADLAAVKAQTGAIETDTQDLQTQIGTDGAGLTNMPWNAAWDAEVQSEAQDAITASALATAANLATLAGYVDTEVAAILAAVDTEVAAIKAKTDYLPSATAGAAGGVFIAGANAATTVNITGSVTGNLSGSVGSVTGAVGSVTGNVGGNVVGSVGSVSGDTKQTADVAALITTVGVAGAGLTALATQASVNTIDDFLDTEIAAILADTNELQTDLVNGGRLDLLIDAIKAKTDVIPASPAAVGSAMTLTAAYDAAKTAATQVSVDAVPTAAEIIAAMDADPPGVNVLQQAGNAVVPTATPGIIYASATEVLTLVSVDAISVRSALGMGAANLDTQLADLPTNAELATALAGADDATLAAIAALNNLSSAQAQAAAAAALTAYDPPTNAELEARTLLAADYTVVSDLPSAATIAGAVWDEALSGHAGTGSTGAALAAAGAVGDPWATALPGAYGAGTAGKLLSDIEAVAPDNKPTVAATGEATANVTMQAGVAVAAADANGNVPVVLYPTQGAVTFGQVKILANVGGEGALHVVNSHADGYGQRNQGGNAGQNNYGGYAGQHNSGGNRGQHNYGGSMGQYNEGSSYGQNNYGGLARVVGAASQEIADALKMAPAAGTPAVGSVYDLLGDAAIDPQAVRDAMKLAPSAGAAEAGSVDAKLDDILTTIGSEIVEGTYTRDDILRIIAAALAGKTSGSGTATVEILGLDGATTRIIASVDGVGNRTAMTLDGAA